MSRPDPRRSAREEHLLEILDTPAGELSIAELRMLSLSVPRLQNPAGVLVGHAIREALKHEG
jgi:hypothetical protein